MKCELFFVLLLVTIGQLSYSGEPSIFETRWVPTKPEVLTYKSTSPQGSGLYQVSLSRGDSTIEVYLNMISPGFTKTVTGSMTFTMHPLSSEARIFVNDQIGMTTRCLYEDNRLHISTIMKPYNRVMAADSTFEAPVVDFSQIPLLVRVLPLKTGMIRTFGSVNPRTNQIVPLTLQVAGKDTVQKIPCLRVKLQDFEGLAIYWVEKRSPHRVIRIEQPESHRVTELLQ